MNRRISKGNLVRIRTTNGGECIVKLLEDYRPTYSFAFVTDYGYQNSMLPERVKSIDVVFNYWTPPLSAAEVANIRGKLAMQRRAVTY